MKKIFIAILLAAACIIFTGCSANMKAVEQETKDKLENSKLEPYIENVTYEAGEKEDGETPVNIKVNVNEKFSDLSNMDKYAIMNDVFKKITESYNLVSCGGNNTCRYQNLQLSYDDDTFFMNIFDEVLVINDLETYTKGDYELDIDRKNQKTKSSNDTYKANSNNASTSAPQNEQFASNGINYKVIFAFMKEQYNIVTNNDENYIPEVHDPQVAKLAAKRFGISEQEAGDIYVNVQMDAFR
ncbi:hypothetical protein BCJMU51_4880 [Bacillus cereus]|uniref:Lipoprotein n=1 Tax=Bacillus cereus TaxID=1396 RepID=A0A150AUA0_BACCE|nr:hypothetical protein IIK_00018 [Bacillus cereus VD102]KLA12068.1 hypothetical protein B4087_4539 [Bacillus cereus]OUA67676.1 hypothetical protein BK786_10135 [Bacillus thuringiensis serovar thailandensis]RSC63857.1 hypothetical protein EGS86_18955 [Bacillus sp. (in: firmicutes)]HDR7794051.1 hypothetical protein [Bacillus luti]HDX9541401.1 hypothetical protein [Bacillus thuringiensis]